MAGVNFDNVLRQLTQQGLENLKERLLDERQISTLKHKRTDIINAVSDLASASQHYENMSKRFSNKSVSALLQRAKQEQYQEIALIDAAKYLYSVEHQTLNYLTKDKTAVTDVKIMMQSAEVGIVPYAYFTFSEKEIIDMMEIDPNQGELIIKQSAVLANIATTKKEGEDINFIQFEAFVKLMIGSMWEQLQQLADLIAKERAGGRNWKRYIELRAIFGFLPGTNKPSMDDISPQRLLEIYEYYMYGKALLSSVDYASIGKAASATGRTYYNAAMTGNRGHIFEAYLHQLTEGTSTVAALGSSFGSKPWWAGGDVGTSQAKAMVGGIAQNRIATIDNMLHLATQLVELLDRMTDIGRRKTAVLKKIDRELNKKANSNKTDGYIQKVIETAANKELGDKLLKDFLINLNF